MKLVLDKDPVAEKLKKDGHSIKIHRLNNDNPDSMVIGYHFNHGVGDFVFRVEKENPTTVLIPHYGITSKQAGLKNAFQDFLWFIEYLTAPDLKLKHVKGAVYVETKDLALGKLSAKRIVEFYKKLGARPLENEGLTQWVVFDLKDFSGMRKLYHQYAGKYLED